MLIFYRDTLLAKLSNLNSIPSDTLHHQYQSQLVGLNHIVGIQTAAIALFWAALGVIVYFIYLGIRNVAVEVRNDVVIGTQYKKPGSLLSQLRRPALKSVLAMVFVVSVGASAALGLPFWLSMFGGVFMPGITMLVILAAPLAIVGLALNLYMLWRMLQLVISIN